MGPAVPLMIMAMLQTLTAIQNHAIGIKRGEEALQMQRDWEKNTGRKMRYPWNNDFSVKGMQQMMNGVSGLGQELYNAHGVITRWLRK